jgi:hypothetical protein
MYLILAYNTIDSNYCISCNLQYKVFDFGSLRASSLPLNLNRIHICVLIYGIWYLVLDILFYSNMYKTE